MPHKIVLRWKAPPRGVYKINYDANIDKTRKLMGVGAISRDSEGKVLETLFSPKIYIIDPTMAQAFVAWKALLFGRDLGLRNVILEGDALDIVL